MKRLIGLLFLAPALASATTDDNLHITSGSMMLGEGVPQFDEFTVSGPNFSATGSIGIPPEAQPGPIGAANIIGLGDHPTVSWNAVWGDELNMSLTINGVPWGLPGTPTGPGGGAFAGFVFTVGPITGPGIYSTPFSFGATYLGVPAALVSVSSDCLQCTFWNISGGGVALVDVVPEPEVVGPDLFYIDKASFTFNAPEPTTVSLLLLALAALGLQAWTRIRRGPTHQLN